MEVTSMRMITGNTYPVKDALKAMGGRWNADKKAWMVPDEMAIQAQELVAQAPGKRSSYPRRQSRYGSSYTRFNSGAEVFTNRNGRCLDAPCCGCCS